MMAPLRPWPAKTVNTLAPSAAIRSSTAFCAPEPSATMVITAPTPMMMPSMVSIDRSAFDRIDEMATANVSPRSIALPCLRGGAARSGAALLLHAGDSTAAGHLVHALAHIFLRLDQA